MEDFFRCLVMRSSRISIEEVVFLGGLQSQVIHIYLNSMIKYYEAMGRYIICCEYG